MGGVVSFEAPKDDEKTTYTQNLIDDTKAIAALFKDMTMYGNSRGVINANSDLLSLAEILLYIEKEINPELSHHYKGMMEMIKESFYYIVGFKKKVRLEISSKLFHDFMCALFMFSNLWKLFSVADDNIDDDSIFIGEFIRAKEKIRRIEGVTFLKEISDEEWKEEFNKIDVGGKGGRNGWVSFREFASYCCKVIVTPDVYFKASRVKKKPERLLCESSITHNRLEESESKNEAAKKNESATVLAAVLPSSPPSSANTSAACAMGRVTSIRDTVLKCKGKRMKPDLQGKRNSKARGRKGTKGEKKEGFVSRKLKDVTHLQETSVKKKTSKKKGAKLSKFKARIAPFHEKNNIIIPTVSLLKPHGDDDNADVCEVDFSSSPGASSPVDAKVLKIGRVAVEKREKGEMAECHEEEHEESIRPLYRPRSAGQIALAQCDRRAWIDIKAASATRRNWVPASSTTQEDVNALSLEKGNEPINRPGFGIAGVDVVSFAYDMREVVADDTAHKKYLLRKKEKGKLWQPKHVTRKVQVMTSPDNGRAF